MRFISKNFTKIPQSLTSELTHKRRREIIENKAYISKGKYNSRYKKNDVKTELANLYKNKCAFCEQKVERFDVEHFRPKSIYYWLAFSWDNLLPACPVCNGNKTNYFKTLKRRVRFREEDYKNIHKLSKQYDAEEESLFFNPESENPEKLISFTQDGRVFSRHKKISYTIETCRLNRPYLIQRRKKIIDTFRNRENELYFLYLKTKNKDYLYELKALRKIFKKEAYDDDNEFTAFRRYILFKIEKNSKSE